MRGKTVPHDDLVQYYDLEERGGLVVFIEAHKRVTAKMLASRYDTESDAEAVTWNTSEVAVWTDDADVVDDIRASIPERDVITEIHSNAVSA